MNVRMFKEQLSLRTVYECVLESYFPFFFTFVRSSRHSNRLFLLCCWACMRDVVCIVPLARTRWWLCGQRARERESARNSSVVVYDWVDSLSLSICVCCLLLLLLFYFFLFARFSVWTCKRVHRCVVIHIAYRRQLNRCCQTVDKAKATHNCLTVFLRYGIERRRSSTHKKNTHKTVHKKRAEQNLIFWKTENKTKN